MRSQKRTGGTELLMLRSHLSLAGVCPGLDAARVWYEAQREASLFEAKIIDLEQARDWSMEDDPSRLVHRSGKFFTVEGLRVKTTFGPVKSWDQPIINQPEIGILGFLTRRFDGLLHFLVQAKREPGNVNTLQLAPTVQATWSNYTRVHKGKGTPYLEYFVSNKLSRTLLDQIQTEQGSRFLGKRNRNMIVEATGEVEVLEGFKWLTLGQLKALLGLDNVVNMDARSVLSLIPMVSLDTSPMLDDLVEWNAMDERSRDVCLSCANSGREQASMDEILAWLNTHKTSHRLVKTRVPLQGLNKWIVDGQSIRHEEGLFFSVIGLSVSAFCRETNSWDQPILHHPHRGLRGFLLKRINGILHLLARTSLDPGSLDGAEIGPTVSCSDVLARRGGRLAPRLLDVFLEPNPADVYYRGVQSEEGGRFHHFENEYILMEAPQGMSHPGPNYKWMTIGQLLRLARHGHLNMEARNLLACLSLMPVAQGGSEGWGGRGAPGLEVCA